MLKEDKKSKFNNAIIWFLVVISVAVIVQTSFKYYVNKDFLLVDKISCIDNEENCFTPDTDDGDPYKVLIFDKFATLTCTEKDASCNIDNICGTNSFKKCRLVGCNDNLNIIPEGYATSEECFIEK